ncbi:MAG: alpha-L-fucosidase [Firmicutes bacterium]|nr:alpha-L-fucosidase [Bacillota bacterium]
MFDKKAHENRTKWFLEARFGMFIHWGLYAIPARGEWVQAYERMSAKEYEKYFHEFNPDSFCPSAWAKSAKAAGMKYAVLTAKHHDGFCLFDSALTEFKATNTRAGRDFVREFLDAFRAEGLKVGLYYSLIDWRHKDYPHYGDFHHPMGDNRDYEGQKHDFDNYLDYMHGQVRELCANYGKLDIMWFDFSYDSLMGEAWRASQLIKTIRSYQPDIIMNNRLEVSGSGFGSLLCEQPKDYYGDFVSPEQIIPPYGIKDEKGDDVPWEACVTMNKHWGYCSADNDYKKASTLIKKLVECVSKGGNMLLNVGPDARGDIPARSLEILAEIGQWMKNNSESIYGCGRATPDKPENGRITAKGKTLYYHITEKSIGDIPLHGVREEEIKRIRLLKDKSELRIQKSWIVNNYPDVVFVPEINSADETDTVIEVELK